MNSTQKLKTVREFLNDPFTKWPFDGYAYMINSKDNPIKVSDHPEILDYKVKEITPHINGDTVTCSIGIYEHMDLTQKLKEIDYSDPYTVKSLISKALFYSLGPGDLAYYAEFIDADNHKHHQYVTHGNGVPFIIFDLYEHDSEVVVTELHIQKHGTVCKMKE